MNGLGGGLATLAILAFVAYILFAAIALWLDKKRI